jgi:hypothetical protein
LWLALVVLISIPVSMLISPKGDMRGGEAIDRSGAIQVQSLVVVNLTVGVWLISVVANQLFS